MPWKEIGYKTKGDIHRDPDAVNSVKLFIHKIKSGSKAEFPDSCAYVRSHICDLDENKVRAVWGYPASVTFAEAIFTLPLIKAYQTYGSPIAYGYEPTIGGFRKMYKRFDVPGIKYGFDFRKYDKHVPAWLIDKAFDILGCNIDYVNYEDHGVAMARSTIHLFDRLRDYFINATIRLANGRRYKKDSGIASGSYFTQLIGSIINAILLEYISLTFTGDFLQDYLVMGDDSLIVSQFDFNVFDISKLLKKDFGMELNHEKSCKDEDINKIIFWVFM